MGGMRRSSFSLEKLYTFVTYFLSNVKSEPKTKKRGRPQKYADKVIIASLVVSDFNGTPLTEKRLPWLLNKTFLPPLYGIGDFKVKNLEEKLLKVFIEEISKVFFRGEARVKHYIGLCHRVWLWR